MLIQAQNVSNVASVDFTSGISSTPAQYFLLFDSVVCPLASTDSYLMVQLSDDGGMTYQNSNYINYLAGSVTTGLACGLLYDGGGMFAFNTSGRLDLLNIPSGIGFPSCEGEATFFESTTPILGGQTHHGMYNGTPLSVNAIRLVSSDGNNISGNFYLYSY